MEKKYYTHDGVSQRGPFTIDELKELDITNGFLIWYLGLDEWTSIEKLPELHHLIKRIIPPILGVRKDKQVRLYELPALKVERKTNKTFSILLLSLSGVVILLILIILLNKEERSMTLDKITSSKNHKTENIPLAAVEDNGNVYVLLTQGIKKQLTFNQSDSNPILLSNKKQIIFVRSETHTQTIKSNSFFGRDTHKNYQAKRIMLINIDDSKESVLTDKKPYEDGNDGTNEILNVNYPVLSLDEEYLLFVTEKYVTGSQLVKVNLETGIWTELFTAETFEQINKEPYKGCFFVGQSDIRDRGRDIYYRLVNESGRIVKEFNNKESMIEFKNGLGK